MFTACDSGATYKALYSGRTPGLTGLTEVKVLTQYPEYGVMAQSPKLSCWNAWQRMNSFEAAEGYGSVDGCHPSLLLLTGVCLAGWVLQTLTLTSASA